LTFGKQLLLTSRQLIDCRSGTLPIRSARTTAAGKPNCLFHTLQPVTMIPAAQGTADAQINQQTTAKRS